MTALRRGLLRWGIPSLGAFLRELSGESAYQRHLAAHGREHSAEEWRRFSDERFHAKYRKPKCC